MKTVWKFAAVAGLACGLVIATPAVAQREPAYAAARAAGQVGEKMDGYLGVVGAGTRELQRIVSDINIKRRDKYTQGAQAATPPATLEEFAFAAGCNLIAQTQPGEKYQGPDGSWQTRTSAAPLRDSRCPPAR